MTTAQCSSVHTSPLGNSYRCELDKWHKGAHRKHRGPYEGDYMWPSFEAPQCFPPSYSPGGMVNGKTAYQQWFDDEWNRLQAIKDAEEFKKPDETSVLLTKEDLKVIAYYLPDYTDDPEDGDNKTKAKIDAALKRAL